MTIMMANLQARHHIVINTLQKHSINNNNNNNTKLLLHKHRSSQNVKFKVTTSSVSESNSSSNSGSSSALVHDRPPNTNEDHQGVMIDQATVVESGPQSSDRHGMNGSDLEWLVSDHGWKVRRMAESKGEMKLVALIQAHAFHVPSLFFDDFFFHFFQAEVLAGLSYRLRNSPPDRYACLVAEPEKEEDASVKSKQNHELVGVVDITVLRDNDVVQHLEGTQEYLYVSGIAVSDNYRRRKVATVLLQACEVMSMLWGYECLVLRAYEDDLGARTLYSNAGYKLVSTDPVWVTWIGRKRRILMVKRLWSSGDQSISFV